MILSKKQGMTWIDINKTNKKYVFLCYKKCSLVVVIFVCGLFFVENL